MTITSEEKALIFLGIAQKADLEAIRCECGHILCDYAPGLDMSGCAEPDCVHHPSRRAEMRAKAKT